MRTSLIALSSISLVCLTGAADAEPPVMGLDNPAYSKPAKPITSVEEAVAKIPDLAADPDGCRDTINKARVEAGKLPFFGNDTASPDNPHMIYAVDRREGECSVMVMKGDPDDVRPLPKADSNMPQLIPAEGDKRK